MKQKKYNKYASIIEARTRKSTRKIKVKQGEQPIPVVMSEDLDFHNYEKHHGFCLLNLNKTRMNGELYKNSEFNKELRRKFNFTQPQLDNLIESYEGIRKQFNTRKAMLKYIRKLRRKEREERRNGSKLVEQETGASTSTEAENTASATN